MLSPAVFFASELCVVSISLLPCTGSDICRDETLLIPGAPVYGWLLEVVVDAVAQEFELGVGIGWRLVIDGSLEGVSPHTMKPGHRIRTMVWALTV